LSVVCSVAAARARLTGRDARLRLRRARTAAVEAGASLRLAPRATVPHVSAERAAVATQDGGGWLPLHSAARYNHVSVVGPLLQRGASVNARTKVRRPRAAATAHDRCAAPRAMEPG
jgi:hypothetical protein